MSSFPRSLLLIALVVGLALPAVVAQGPQPTPQCVGGPCLQGVVTSDGDELELRASGPAGTVGHFRAHMVEYGSTTVQTFELPVAFDALGQWAMDVDLEAFAIFGSFDMMLELEVADPATGSPQFAVPWGLRMERRTLDKTLAELVQAGVPLSGLWHASLPGTSGPSYPVSWHTIASPGPGNGTTSEVLIFLTGPFAYLQSIPGIEGVFPVN